MKLETFGEKVKRHIREGGVDLHTVVRGMTTLGEWLRSGDILSCSIQDRVQRQNIGNNPGLDDSRYTYVLRNGYTIGKCDIVDFPRDSQLKISVTPPDKFIYIEDSLQSDKRAIAELVGPTHVPGVYLANNGFFLSNNPKDRVAFMDTNPPGERRGAIVVGKSGLTRIVKDDEKWKVVRSKFRGVNAMAGTSVYLTSQDTSTNTELLQDVNRSIVSYLIQYVDAMRQTRFSYIVISTCVPRIIAQFSIAHHMDKLKAVSWIAAELELNGSGCLVKNKKSGECTSIGDNWPAMARRDHYSICQPRG